MLGNLMDFCSIVILSMQKSENTQTKDSDKGGTMPQDSLRAMMQFLPAATVNLLKLCLEIIRKNCTRDSGSICLESFGTPSGPCDEMMNNVCREHAVCFKVPDNEHYYIGLTLPSFKNFS